MLRVPGIARLAERVPDGAAERELGHVQLAEQDAARGREPRHHGGVLAGYVVGQQARPRRGPHAARGELILHREGHAVEGPERAAGHHGVLGLARGSQRRLARHRDVGTQPAVEAIDPLEVGAHHLHGRELLDADERGLPGRAEIDAIVGHGVGS